MNYIYGLFDPRLPLELGHCRYIGQTPRSLSVRLGEHISTARSGRFRRHVCHWIRSLLDEGVEPVVQLIEQLDTDDVEMVDAAERRWIAKGRAEGWVLTNDKPGGRGLHASNAVMCPCGEGPFVGIRGLRLHQERFCPLDHPDARLAFSLKLTEIYQDDALRQRISQSVAAARGREDKTPVGCTCGAGPFLGPRALNVHRANSLKCTDPTPQNDQIPKKQHLGTLKSPEARAKIAERQRNNRWRCLECGAEMNGGLMTRHQNRTDHVGKECLASKDLPRKQGGHPETPQHSLPPD